LIIGIDFGWAFLLQRRRQCTPLLLMQHERISDFGLCRGGIHRSTIIKLRGEDFPMGRAAGVNTFMGEALMALQEISPGKPVSTAADIWLFIGI
jgi:hypothetical protein